VEKPHHALLTTVRVAALARLWKEFEEEEAKKWSAHWF
jgi:hypothetical protein